MCPNCDRVYDESDYSTCPYCSGDIELEVEERYYKTCPLCDGIMYYFDCWECSNCGHELYTDEDDCDGIIEGVW